MFQYIENFSHSSKLFWGLAHNSFCGSTTTKRYTLCDQDTGEEGRDQEIDNEDAIEEEVSEVEDKAEYNPDQETTDVEQSSDEEEGPAECCCYIPVKEWEFVLVFITDWQERSAVDWKCYQDDPKAIEIRHILDWWQLL